MRKSKKALALLLTVGLLAGMFSGCGSSSPSTATPGSAPTPATSGDPSGAANSTTPDTAEWDADQTLNIRSTSAVIGLNPMVNTSQPDNQANGLFCEGLVRRVPDEKGNAVILPGVAESWDVSADGLTYTFRLRKNAKWSDGSPVTANDYLFTFRKMADPATAAGAAWLYDGVIENFGEALYNNGKTPEEIGVKLVDDYTLEIKILNPISYFLELIEAAKPVNEKLYTEFGDSYGSAPDKAGQNGAFVIESWDQNTQMTLVKNENYWDAENIKLQKINIKVISESATAAQAFIGGDIDSFGTNDPNWIELISAEEGANYMHMPDNAPEFLTFNCANEYFKNAKVRLAFSLSIDREKYVQDLRNGLDYPIYSLQPDHTMVGTERYTDLVGGKNNIIKRLQSENPDPKALLIEGLTELGKDPDPAKMTIRYATRGTSEFSKKNAEWLKQMWKEKLGVDVTIDMMEWNIMWDKIDEGDYDIATGGWGPYYNEPSALLGIYEPEAGYFDSKKTGWNDEDSKKFSELLKTASQTVDVQEKADLYLQAEELLVGKAVIAPTYLPSVSSFLRNYVKNYYYSSIVSPDFNIVGIQGK